MDVDGAGTIDMSGCSGAVVLLFSFDVTVWRLRLGCGLAGLRTVRARETFEFTEETTEVVSR